MFENVVQLYRAASRPELEDGIFRFEGPVTPSLAAALKAVEELSERFGNFRSGPDYVGGKVDFSWACGSNEHGRFHADLNRFLSASISLSRGVPPTNCYLVKEDYSVGESPVPEELVRLTLLCELIVLLEKLSLIPDERTNTSQPKSLIFVVPAGDGQPPKTIQLATLITAVCLLAPSPRLDVLRQVVSDQNSGSLHRQEHRSLFRLAVADVLQKAPSDELRFSYLVEHWKDVLQKYEYDVDCLIDNFSFDKLRQEIAKTSLEFSTRLTAVLGDNTGKFLALPVPILAVAGIVKAETFSESVSLLLSALAVAIIFSGTTKNQFIQLGQLESGFNSAFDKFLKPGAATADSIMTQIRVVQTTFNKQRRLLQRVLWFLRVGAWFPPICGLIAISYRFNPCVHTWIFERLP